MELSPMPEGPFQADPYANVYTKEGLLAVAEGVRLPRPDRLDMQALAALTPEAKEDYDDARRDWHSNLGPYKIKSLADVVDDMWCGFDQNRQLADKVKPGFVVLGPGGVAKTTSLVQLAARVHRHRVRRKGTHTASGHQRLPVCLITLTGNPGILDLNTAGLEFYGCLVTPRSSAADRLRLWRECVLACETELVIIDDFHFLDPQSRNGSAVSNHIKTLATSLRATIALSAIKVHEGLLNEGLGTEPAARLRSQTARRFVPHKLEPLPKPLRGDHTKSCDGRCNTCQWNALIKSFEHDIVLADSRLGMLSDLAPSLWAMSQGHLASLALIVQSLTYKAVRTGKERIDREDLSEVKLDHSAGSAFLALKGARDGKDATGRGAA